MIRFIPDTWLEALLRFFAMAAPDGNVYVEIAAPDVRFAAIVLLAIAIAFLARRLVANPRPAIGLLALVLASTVPWLLTSGNGRYWIPMLLCAGPLAIGLVYLLPLTRAFRTTLAFGLLALQTFVVLQSPPWDSWSWVVWEEAPYFQLELPPVQPNAPPTTYVTLTSISYSLIAPQFPASSRWINITNVGAAGRDAAWAADFLAHSPGPIKLIAPTIKGQVAADRGPTPEVRNALDAMLGSQRLALASDRQCDLLHSSGLVSAARAGVNAAKEFKDAGFWVCPLRYPVERPPEKVKPVDPATEAAFARLEQMCPRFFHPGAKTVPINGGSVRQYAGSDMKAYVLDNGEVWYKFWRALNPVMVGKLPEVLSGKAHIDCDAIRGRAGLPWDREI
jgi:hypothetical protein